MKSPGTMLREARESRGLSLTEAAALTRIPRTVLSHLEHDRFDEFRAGVFVRGHLRNYAREVGVDPELAVKSFEKLSGTYEPSAQTVETMRKQVLASQEVDTQDASVRRKHIKLQPTHMLAAALVLAAAVIFVSLLSGTRATAEDPADFPTSSQQEWELEQEVQETRWLLEQPAKESDAPKKR